MAESAIDIGPLPAECYTKTGHAPKALGDELAVLLRLERAQLDEADAKLMRCVKYHTVQRTDLKATRLQAAGK